MDSKEAYAYQIRAGIGGSIESLKDNERLFFDYQLEPPEVSSILKLKGTLRISWAFDMKYNKQIDLIFFPEDNPYLNYAVLYAKDFKKTINNDEPYYRDRQLSGLDIPFDINYDFVKEILLKSGSQDTQNRFFNYRFGSVYINIEVEFEWWSLGMDFDTLTKEMIYPENCNVSFNFLAYDSSILQLGIDEMYFTGNICLGTIKSHKLLPSTTKLNFSPYLATWEFDSITYHLTHSEALAPLPTSTLAQTYTNINDFIINVRDKPTTKDSTIITQLLTQRIKMPDDFMVDMGYSYELNPLYAEMITLGEKWYGQDMQSGADERYYFLYYQHKSKQNYFNKEKHKLINPLKDSDYMILVWNIESNNWAKVWILKYQKSNNNISLEQDLSQNKQDISNNLSKLKLYEGYIHCSGLRYLMPFGENYIKK